VNMADAHDNVVSMQADLLRMRQVKARHAAGRNQNQVVVRFWIITMMLVLVGLSTLKLR
jgi:UDP-N-acetylmuramyl pentapeptide phosphotransferase/UDP-N-acetylglucosamine-1-phosphate transferase